ncbi:hypothetical protein ACA910_014949 [Epithemia clementina (nom. ined.)]
MSKAALFQSVLSTTSPVVPRLIRKFPNYQDFLGAPQLRPPGAAAAVSNACTTVVEQQQIRRGRSMEIWTTPCIVQTFGKLSSVQCCWLINPSNPELSGVRNFPYFPRGGPVPTQNPESSMHKDWQPLGYVSAWGGMEVGFGMLYAVSVVDGLVHQLGGWPLRVACQWHSWQTSPQPPCPVGSAVITRHAATALTQHYNAIVHTTPPFYRHDDDPQEKLAQCYQSALSLVVEEEEEESSGRQPPSPSQSSSLRVACPLLGAGARGFPVDIAIQVAAKACTEWLAATTDPSALLSSSSLSSSSSASTTREAHTKSASREKNSPNGGEPVQPDHATPPPPPQETTTSTTTTTPTITLVFGLLEKSDAELLAHAVEEELQEKARRERVLPQQQPQQWNEGRKG